MAVRPHPGRGGLRTDRHRRIRFGRQRFTALTLARECGTDAAPAWREWAGQDGFGAYARIWLAEQDGAEPAQRDMAWTTVDGLDTLLDALPPGLPPPMLYGLVQDQAGAELAEILPLLADTGHPAAGRLVTFLGGRPMAVSPDGALSALGKTARTPARRPGPPRRARTPATRSRLPCAG